MVYNWLNIIQSIVYPPVCALCGEAGDAHQDICHHCRGMLKPNRCACLRCGNPLPQPASSLCGKCQSALPAFDLTRTGFVYDYPLDSLIQRFKFGRELVLARLLGQLMAEAIEATQPARLPEVFIPVPLHGRRQARRGFNQARELAAVLASHFQLPVDNRICRRTRDTRPQTELPAGLRYANMQRAFQVSASCEYRHVAIVDDVMTTGQTVAALACALKDTGVETVEIWVLARA
jgi:ComF family protein